MTLRPEQLSRVESPEGTLASVGRRLLRIPLFYKILLANSAIVALGAIVGTIVTLWHVRAYPRSPHYELIAFFAGAGFVISFVVNFLAIRLALDPLDRLQAAVERTRRGHMEPLVSLGPLSDERFDRLSAAFNQMLDTLARDSRQLHQLSQAILQAQEDERQRVARELHDEAAQALTSLLVRLRLLERGDDPATARGHVVELRRLTARALEDVRKVALELRPTILDDLGLSAALAWRVDEFNAAGTAQATLEVARLDARLPRQVELTCYRVVQEALTNVSRHASAQTVRILVQCTPLLLRLDICDDGVGFDPVSDGDGLGLRGMRERLALLGGDLSIDSHPGTGTRLSASIPLSNNG